MIGRSILIRAILYQALGDDERLTVNVRPNGYGHFREAPDGLKRIAAEAEDGDWFVAAWGHAGARWYLRQSEANSEASIFDKVQLLIAATHHFQISRSCKHHFLEAYIFKGLSAANSKITGWWRGSRLGAISFLAPAAIFRGGQFYGFRASQKNWGRQ